jgi:hypothetical protein
MVPEAVLPTSTINTDTGSKERVFGIVESSTLAVAMAALIALRLVYAFVYRVDSDEPQHLHVVWGWAHGLIQYKDIFDNHSPLFQMLCAPLFRLIGEHSWIVVPMRLAMLPLYVVDLGIVYLIGRALYFQRWGVWIAMVAGGIPVFFLVTTEFRTDDLWTTLCLAAVWIAVSGPMGGKRAFYFGLMMGAGFAVSMKTSLLLAALGTGAAGIVALHALSRRDTKVLELLKTGVLIAVGMAIMPALLIAAFAAMGALHDMYYCVVVHNTVPGLGKWAKSGLHQWLFPMSLPALFGLGWLCMHSSAHEQVGAGRALILMTCGAYYFLMRSYWPLVTAQDYVPVAPLIALAVLPFIFHLLSLPGWPARVAIPIASLLILGGEVAWIWHSQSPMDNEMAPFEQNLAAVLHLTKPTDYVFDGKGETIFRNRPIRWVLEGVTIRRIQLGLIPNDVRQNVVAKGVCVAVNHRLRPEDEKWLRTNFIEADGKVWIAGQGLGPVRPRMSFRTDIKAKYSIVADGAKLAGTLDGAPLQDSQIIPPGVHRLETAGGSGNAALVWTQALDRGFDPFTKKISGVTE